jgi:hypothetical protein
MPGGISNPALGYATFCVVKFAGYTLAGHVIAKAYGRTDIGAWRVGAVRTAIGMAAGAAYFGVWKLMGKPFGGELTFLYLAGLLPVRIAEWWLLIWLFYDRALADRETGWRIVFLGSAWSYLLDVPAIVGFLATAGVWVC